MLDVYMFDGKDLSKMSRRFQKGDKGIFGLFSVNNPSADSDTLVFYQGGKSDVGFHHPTKRDFEYQNHGFQEFLKEKLNPDKRNVSGGMAGIYDMDSYELQVNWLDEGS